MNMWQFLDANWFQTYIFIALFLAIICGAFMTIFKQIYPDVEHELAQQVLDISNQLGNVVKIINEVIGQEEIEDDTDTAD